MYRKPEPKKEFVDYQPIEVISRISVLAGPEVDDNADLAPAEPIPAGTMPSSWMQYINFILDVQSEFDVTITDDDLERHSTVSGLARVVVSRVEDDNT